MRVALDLMGGDAAPDVVADAAVLVAAEQPRVHLILVGPEDVATRLLADRGAAGACAIAPASQVVEMDEDPARAVRAKRDATVRVAARLVRDGEADATVSAGSTGACLAAGLFTLGRLPGMTRAPLAVVVPAEAGPVVLLDAGANPDAGTDLLAQFALAGASFATARLGLPAPRVGLLSVGTEVGKGDALRRAAYDVLAALPVRFVGNVEGHDVPLGGVADVVVTDGFTGNVLLKGLEGAMRDRLHPDDVGGAVLLGLRGVSVVAHGASTARALASAVALAAQCAEEGLVDRIGASLAELVGRRRAAAGLTSEGAR